MSEMTENNNFQNRQEQNGNPEKKAASFPVYSNIYDAFNQGSGNDTGRLGKENTGFSMPDSNQTSFAEAKKNQRKRSKF